MVIRYHPVIPLTLVPLQVDAGGHFEICQEAKTVAMPWLGYLNLEPFFLLVAERWAQYCRQNHCNVFHIDLCLHENKENDVSVCFFRVIFLELDSSLEGKACPLANALGPGPILPGHVLAMVRPWPGHAPYGSPNRQTQKNKETSLPSGKLQYRICVFAQS